MTTGNPFKHLSTTELVARAFDMAGALSLESLDQLVVVTCRHLLIALAHRFASDPTDLHEPHNATPAEFADAYARWAEKRCAVERQRVLGIAALQVLGMSRRGGLGCAHFHRPCTTEVELLAALCELQEVGLRKGIGSGGTTKFPKNG